MRRDRILQRWDELEPLLDHLLELETGERERAIEAVADTELRALLLHLLSQDARTGLLDHGTVGLLDAMGDAAVDLVDPGHGLDRIGPYRLLQRIGEGGSGSVYLAEREGGEYVQRVAMKLLRVGLRDSGERQRFGREQRILARLEHPNIARLLDGGVTPEGVPWFAMEYVEGESITDWCDRRRVSPAGRIELFLAVCAAVEAAHRQLIVHRDLKPANILVDPDGRPRLLDFGIARLLDDAEPGDDTRVGLRRLTPAYAAPEQFGDGTIGTAADVYALGVLLYELLTGLRPLRDASDEARSASSQLLAAAERDRLAAARGMDPALLARRLRGDVDVILRCALAVDPARRYGSVGALSADLRRHLQQRPIQARPATVGYRLQRFVGRHRLAVAASVLLLLSVVLGSAATWRESGRARAAAEAAGVEADRARAVTDFMLALFSGVTPDETRGRAISALELIERGESRLAETLAGQPQLSAELGAALASAYRQLGALERARELAEEALARAGDGHARAAALTVIGRVDMAAGRLPDARKALEAALDAGAGEEARLALAELLADAGDVPAAREILQAPVEGAAAEGLTRGLAAIRRSVTLGGIAFRAGEIEQAERSLRAALTRADADLPAAHTERARAQHDLGVVRLQQGDPQEAARLLEQAVAQRAQLLGERHPDHAQSLFNLGIAHQRLGQPELAATLIQQALELQQALLGDAHPDVATSYNSLAVLALQRGDIEAAIGHMESALPVAERAHGGRHPTVATLRGNLAALQRSLGRLDDALRNQRLSLEISREVLGDTHFLTAVAGAGLGAIHAERGDADAAITAYRDAVELAEASLGRAHPDLALWRAAYAEALLDGGQPAAAREQAGIAQRSVGAALAEADPKRLRVELVELRVAASAGECRQRLAELERLAAKLESVGVGMRSEQAAAMLLSARCGAAQAGALRARAMALIEELPYRSRRLRNLLAAAG